MNHIENLQKFDNNEVKWLQIDELKKALKSEYFDDAEEIRGLIEELNKNTKLKESIKKDLVVWYDTLIKKGKNSWDLEDIKILQLYIKMVLDKNIAIDGKINDEMCEILWIDFDLVNMKSIDDLWLYIDCFQNIKDIIKTDDKILLKKYISELVPANINNINEITIYEYFQPHDLIGVNHEQRLYLATNLKTILNNAINLPDSKKYTNNLEVIAKDVVLEKEAMGLCITMISDEKFLSWKFNFWTWDKDPYILSRALIYLRYWEKDYSYIYKSRSSDSTSVKTLEEKYNMLIEEDAKLKEENPNIVYVNLFLEYIQHQGKWLWCPWREQFYILDEKYINIEWSGNTILIENEEISPNMKHILLHMKIGKEILKSSQEFYKNAKNANMKPVYDVYNNALQLNNMLKRGAKNQKGEYIEWNLWHTHQTINILDLAEKNKSLNDRSEMKRRCVFTSSLVSRSLSEDHNVWLNEISWEEKQKLEKNKDNFVGLLQLLNNEIANKAIEQWDLVATIDVMAISSEDKENLNRLISDNRRLITLYKTMEQTKIDTENIQKKEREIVTANILCDRYYHGKKIDPEIFFSRFGSSNNNQDVPRIQRINILDVQNKRVGSLVRDYDKVSIETSDISELITTAEDIKKGEEETLSKYYKTTLLPIMNIVDINLSDYKKNLDYIKQNELVAISFLWRLNTDVVNVLGIDLTGVDDSSLWKITKMYSEAFVRGLKKIYPKAAPTKEQFAEICPPDWDLSTWPKITSPMTAVFWVPYMLDFSKYPDGEVVVAQPWTIGRMRQQRADGEYRDFTKEVFSVVWWAAMTTIPWLRGAHWLIKWAVFYGWQKLTKMGLNYWEMVYKSVTGQEEYGSFWNAAWLWVGEAFNIYEIHPTWNYKVDEYWERVIKPISTIIGEQTLEYLMWSILFTRWRHRTSQRVAKWMQRPIVGKLAYGSISPFQAKFLTTATSLGAEATLFTALGIVSTPITEWLMEAIRTEWDWESSLSVMWETALSMIQPRNILDSFIHTSIFIGSLRATNSVISNLPKNRTYSEKQQRLVEEHDKNLSEFSKKMKKHWLESDMQGEKIRFFKKSAKGEIVEVDIKKYPDLNRIVERNIRIWCEIQWLQDVMMKKSKDLKDHEYIKFCEKNMLNNGLESPEKIIQERIDWLRRRGKEFEAQQWEKKLKELETFKADFYANARALWMLEWTAEYNKKRDEAIGRNTITLPETQISAKKTNDISLEKWNALSTKEKIEIINTQELRKNPKYNELTKWEYPNRDAMKEIIKNITKEKEFKKQQEQERAKNQIVLDKTFQMSIEKDYIEYSELYVKFINKEVMTKSDRARLNELKEKIMNHYADFINITQDWFIIIEGPFGSIRKPLNAKDSNIKWITQKTIINEQGVGEKLYINKNELNNILVESNGHLMELSSWRLVILVKVWDVVLPFYRSSEGTSGKIMGNRYPFFWETKWWVIKWNVNKQDGSMNYGNQKIAEVTKTLNDNFKIPTSELLNVNQYFYEWAMKLSEHNSNNFTWFHPNKKIQNGSGAQDLWMAAVLWVVEGKYKNWDQKTMNDILDICKNFKKSRDKMNVEYGVDVVIEWITSSIKNWTINFNKQYSEFNYLKSLYEIYTKKEWIFDNQVNQLVLVKELLWEVMLIRQEITKDKAKNDISSYYYNFKEPTSLDVFAHMKNKFKSKNSEQKINFETKAKSNTNKWTSIDAKKNMQEKDPKKRIANAEAAMPEWTRFSKEQSNAVLRAHEVSMPTPGQPGRSEALMKKVRILKWELIKNQNGELVKNPNYKKGQEVFSSTQQNILLRGGHCGFFSRNKRLNIGTFWEKLQNIEFQFQLLNDIVFKGKDFKGVPVSRERINDSRKEIENLSRKKQALIENNLELYYKYELEAFITEYNGKGTAVENLAKEGKFNTPDHQNWWLYNKYVTETILTKQFGDGNVGGYKLHISANKNNFDNIVREMWNFLYENGIWAKVSPWKKNVTDIHDAQFGKVFTVYPKNWQEVNLVIKKSQELAKNGYGWVYANNQNNLFYEGTVSWTNNILYYTLSSINGKGISYKERAHYREKYVWECPFQKVGWVQHKSVEIIKQNNQQMPIEISERINNLSIGDVIVSSSWTERIVVAIKGNEVKLQKGENIEIFQKWKLLDYARDGTIKEVVIGQRINFKEANSFEELYRELDKESEIYPPIIRDGLYDANISKKAPREIKRSSDAIFIGDLHGEYIAFQWNLKSVWLIDHSWNWIGWNKKIIFQWDILADRWTDSFRILYEINKLRKQARAKWWEIDIVAWNHEDFLISFLTNRNWIHNSWLTISGPRSNWQGAGIIELGKFTNRWVQWDDFSNFFSLKNSRIEIIENMRKSTEGKIILEEICNMKVVVQINDVLVLHTNPTDGMLQYITQGNVQQNIQNVNKTYQWYLRKVLLWENNNYSLREFNQISDIFLNTSNRNTSTSDSYYYTLHQSGINYITHWHSGWEWKEIVVGNVRVIDNDYSYGKFWENINGPKSVSSIDKWWFFSTWYH